MVSTPRETVEQHPKQKHMAGYCNVLSGIRDSTAVWGAVSDFSVHSLEKLLLTTHRSAHSPLFRVVKTFLNRGKENASKCLKGTMTPSQQPCCRSVIIISVLSVWRREINNNNEYLLGQELRYNIQYLTRDHSLDDPPVGYSNKAYTVIFGRRVSPNGSTSASSFRGHTIMIPKECDEVHISKHFSCQHKYRNFYPSI